MYKHADGRNRNIATEVFTNSPQYKNANVANFVLAVP